MKKTIIIILIFLIVGILAFTIFVKYNQNSNQVVVLAYHNIVLTEEDKKDDKDALTVEEFKNQMEYLKQKEYVSISVDELYKWKEHEIELPDKAFLITFDDGYYSFKHIVEPILQEYNFKAICFVIGNSTPENTIEYNPETYGTIGKDEISYHISNVEYGSHTYGLHKYSENGNKMIQEKTKQELAEDIENFDINVFKAEYIAYPFYTYTNNIIDELKKHNYKLGFAGEEEMATRNVNNFKIPRISGVKTLEEFKKIFETKTYRNKYGNGFIRKICVNIERKLSND